ncbi:MAG: hypothetical protein M0015_03715 [Betaproteobacteria bacterium]|nr:hypothetical protein [Betaproteobacteria bacterium]
MPRTLSINRAPVLTLWATIVAERLGFDHDEALTLGHTVAGLNAYSKGVSLGLFTPAPEEVKARRATWTRSESSPRRFESRPAPFAICERCVRQPGSQPSVARACRRRFPPLC